METKNNKLIILLLLLSLVLGVVGYNIGKNNTIKEYKEKEELLYSLNRNSIENISIENNGVIYVIGHKSPDTDTVVSAIAYARLLNMLGYEAKAVITEEINNETKYILEQAGVDVPEQLYDASGENIFLVDHSEYAQAVEGLDDAHIVGVIDHHGVGSISTGNQVVYQGRPMGSTATIIWLDYLNCGLEIDKTTAYLLLSAILSDTNNLTGTTSSSVDAKAVEELAKIAGVDDVDSLYRKIHEEQLSYGDMSGLEILFSDYKEYEASGKKFGIGLINSIDEDASKKLSAMMKEALVEGVNMKEVDYLYASVGIRENGEKIDYIIPADEKSKLVFEAAFPDYDEYDGTAFIFRKGLGRKTLFVPGFTDYLASHPHE